MAEDRKYQEPPSLDPAIREQMTNALYDKFYSNALPRDAFDKQIAGKSDFEIANSAYDTFYSGKLPRDQFNQQVGLRSASGSTLGALVSGATLGLADEVSGAVSGAASALRGEGFGAGYDRTTRGMRENAEVYRQNNPYLGRGVEIAGGVSAGIPRAAGSFASAASRALAPISYKMAAQGAGLGAVAGAGDATGGVEDRLQGAAIGTAIGAALPPAIAGAAALTAPAARGTINMLGLGNPVSQADRQIAQALMQGGQTTQGVRGALAAAPIDKPLTLSDLGGRNVTGLGAVAANRPGASMTAADNLVEARRFAAPDRIAADVDRMVAPGSGSGVADATQTLMQQRQTAAQPLYKSAFSKPVGMTDRLREFVDDPIMRTGLARGLEIQRLENVALPPGQRRPIQDAAIQFAEDGTPRIVGTPNLRTLDAAKRGLDDILEKEYRNPQTGRLDLDQRGRAIEQVRKAYVAELDRGSTPYAEARAAWAGPSQAHDAINMGRKLISGDRDAVARSLDNVTEANRDFFRLGVARALTDRTTDPAKAGNFVRQMVEDRTLSGKLRSIFDQPADYENFVRSMQAELLMRDTNKAISPRAGSQTFRLGAGEEAMNQGAGGGLALDLLQLGAQGGKPHYALANRIMNRAKTGGIDTAEQIGERLFAPDAARVQKALTDVDMRQAFDALRQNERQQMIRALLGGASAAIPQQVN